MQLYVVMYVNWFDKSNNKWTHL